VSTEGEVRETLGERIKKFPFKRRRLSGVQRKRVNLRRKTGMPVYVLPNLFTTANMFFGFFAIIYAIKGDYTAAAYAIIGAAIFDFFDGRVARMTNATSHFGAEYDSLSDLVSFGMAPAILMFLWALKPFGRLGWLAAFMFVACGALRLARFNVQAHIVEGKDFQGLPIPMAAGIVSGAVLAFKELEWHANKNIWLLIMTFMLSLVMVSTFRYRSFKSLDLKDRVPFRYLIAVVVFIGVVAWWPEVMLWVLFLTYAVLGAIFGVLHIGKSKEPPAIYFKDGVNDDFDDYTGGD
jgi:CDP-diacylglycerol--serine O-phosphatidyltransferase